MKRLKLKYDSQIPDEQLLKELLEREGIIGDELLFRGLRGERRRQNLLKHGVDNLGYHDSIMALNYHETFTCPMNPSLFFYCNSDVGSIAVYDKKKFLEIEDHVHRHIGKTKIKNSLLAVIFVQFPVK